MNDRLPLTTPDPIEERLEVLKTLMPEAFSEGKLDLERLKAVLGQNVETGRERYGLSWVGKAEAIRAVQVPSRATLRPMREQSVNFDESENLILEGDNFEVLKMLQYGYHREVKLIYIDPPYNTGSEFIYSDDFSDPMHEYLVYTGQIENGVKTSSKSENGGRFHSRWLSMLYPRLQLAKSLLKDDGSIFVSIDDHELHSLREIMDEIFGRENFITNLIWQKVYSPKNSAIHFSEDHDYVVVYAKNAEKWRPTLLRRTDEANARYENPDNDKRGDWKPADMTARLFYSEGQYEVIGPSGRVFTPSRGRYWTVSKERFEELDAEGRVWWGQNNDATPQQKKFLTEVKQGMVPQTLWLYGDVGHTQEAKRELMAHVDYQESDNVLDSVKPTRLIRRILQVATEPNSNDIVLDFFAGSGTTGHAVLAQNTEDEGNRRFILVQFPERLYKAEPHLKTIADVTRARVSKAIENLRSSVDNGLRLHDGKGLGYRAFSLSPSNFKQWDPTNPDLSGMLEALIDNLEPGRTQEDVLFELLLKAGYPLSSPVSVLEVAGQKVYSVDEGKLLIYLERPISEATLRGLMTLSAEQVLCLDIAFEGNDSLKTNIVLEMRDKGILFRTA